MSKIDPKIADYASLLVACTLVAGTPALAQQAPSQPAPDKDTKTTVAPATSDPSEEPVIELTPFEVTASNEQGYNAASTLAGNRLNTELRDLGNAVTVVTKQFLSDTGAIDNQTLLQYLPSGEVGSVFGNFAGTGDGATPDQNSGQSGASLFINPNQNTRVRGLTSADNTRDYFLTDVPWEGYNIDRVDFQRGPNSILFGQGSPAGIINAGTQNAGYRNSGSLETRIGSNGSNREVLNVNRVLLADELALRVALVRNDQKYQQKPAYSLDKRVFGAVRWEPRFLRKGSARTVFKANIEAGDIKSNNPRILPPYDNITPWFYTGSFTGSDKDGNIVYYSNLNKGTFSATQVQDGNSLYPNRGQAVLNLGNNRNPYYLPWAGNFGQQFGSPLMIYNGDSSALQKAMALEPVQYWGINSSGVRTGGVLPFTRPIAVADYATFAKNAHLPFANFGVYKDKMLTDPTIFNFYDNLLDGPNKKEWQNFRVYNLNLAQTFFDDQIGFEGAYNNEWNKSGQAGLFSGWKQGIGIDMMKVYSDGTPDYGFSNEGKAYEDGTPNPNLGRPFVTDSGQFASGETITNRESARVTAFARHDFSHDSFLPKVVGTILGNQTVTGLYARDRSRSDYRSWQWATTGQDFKAFLGGEANQQYFNSNNRTPDPVFYLGSSLLDRTSASGANIPRITALMSKPSTIPFYTFDSHWNKPTDPSDPNYVDPAAAWQNAYYPQSNGSYNSTQSSNPANYVGWVNRPVEVIYADSSKAARDALTSSARLSKNTVKSKALIWQGKLWHNAFVGTAGIREDVADAWATSQDANSNKTTNSEATLNLDPSVYRIYQPNETAPGNLYVAPKSHVEVRSKSWSLVAHLSDLVPNNLPVLFSAYYARSSNFQPFSNRVDVYGHALGAPEGKTKEFGVLIESRNGKYSLKLNKYETTSSNQSSSALGGAWFIGVSQAWAANWVNRYEYNWTGDTIENAYPNGNVAPDNWQYGQFNYTQDTNETIEQAQAREASVIQSWRTWQASINPDFYKAWHINLNDPHHQVDGSVPSGFTVTEDSKSKGYELELNAQVTRNWRMSVNASKTKASRNNIGGAALSDFIAKYEAALNYGAKGGVGDLRIWWGGAGSETTLMQWNQNIGSEYHQRKLQEGTDVPELRKWRFNAITNYDFDSGKLKGFGVGGGLRWQSSVVIGYRPYNPDPSKPNEVSFSMSDPYMGPAETSVDFWMSYRRKITAKIEWVLQLNISNLNNSGDALIPINSQPLSYAGAAYRIRPPRTWQLSSSFNF